MFTCHSRLSWGFLLFVFFIFDLASARSVIFRSPINRIHGQGQDLRYPLFQDIDIRWDSDYTPLTCDVYQQDADGTQSTINVFNRYANTTTQPFAWRARNLPNVSAESPMWFHMYWSQNNSCAGCQTFTTNFTLYNPNKSSEDNDSLPLGLGIGLGVGIPILIAGALGAWWIRRRKRQKLDAVQRSDALMQAPTPSTTKRAESMEEAVYGEDGTIADVSKPRGEYDHSPSAAELGGGNTFELSASSQIHEAEPMVPRAELRGAT